MKALFLKSYGSNIRKRLKIEALHLPELGEYDVLIEVGAAAINPVELKILSGIALLFRRPKRPFVLGFDFSGTVKKIGLGVTAFKKGDHVFGKCSWDRFGCIATHSIMNEDLIAHMPSTLNFVEAAALPLVGCTVIQAFDYAKIKKGDRVLIHAGSGGIGSFAIQYAKIIGAYVYTTTSTSNVTWLYDLGADRVIDYRTENYKSIATNIDVVLNTLGGKYTYESILVLRKGGQIISIDGHMDDQTTRNLGLHPFIRLLNSMKGMPLLFLCWIKNIHYKYVWMKEDKQVLKQVAQLVDQGKIRSIIDREYSLEESVDALVYLQKRHAKGKVIINMDLNS